MTTDFASAANELGVSLDAETVERFDLFRERILNAGFNLLSERDMSLIEQRHFLESIAFGQLLAGRGLLQAGTRVLDIGSGAGLPGLPLKLVWPDVHMTLLESNGKKCDFLRQTAEALGLEGVDVLEGRAETFASEPEHREAYDLVVVRAVASLAVLVEYALPYLRIDGQLAAMKGPGALTEVDGAATSLRELGGQIEDVQGFTPPGGSDQRVVIIKKTALTPDRYPRRVGVASKRPLA